MASRQQSNFYLEFSYLGVRRAYVPVFCLQAKLGKAEKARNTALANADALQSQAKVRFPAVLCVHTCSCSPGPVHTVFCYISDLGQSQAKGTSSLQVMLASMQQVC